MAARRNVLNGVSVSEREEKANLQRDYAAQLQEQVLQKQAKQNQEKARRQQEQRDEMEMLERERVAATRKNQPQQEQTASEPPLPVPSPQRVVSMPHRPVLESQQQDVYMTSPLKSVGPGVTATESEQNNAAPTATTNYGSEAYTPAFSSAPSIFESLIREPGIGARSTSFYEDLAALQRLAVELESAAKKIRVKAQSNYVKPNFLHQEEVSTALPTTNTTAALHSPVKLDDGKAIQDDNEPGNFHHAVPQPILRSSFDGLLGESVLLPLSTAISPPRNFKKMTRPIESPRRPLHDISAVVETEGDDPLDNHSEMLLFTTSER